MYCAHLTFDYSLMQRYIINITEVQIFKKIFKRKVFTPNILGFIQ